MQYKTIIWIIILLISIGAGQAYWCYQQSVNNTNQGGMDGNCQLNYSGSINIIGTNALENYSIPPRTNQAMVNLIFGRQNPGINYSITDCIYNNHIIINSSSIIYCGNNCDVNGDYPFNDSSYCFNGTNYRLIYSNSGTSPMLANNYGGPIYDDLNDGNGDTGGFFNITGGIFTGGFFRLRFSPLLHSGGFFESSMYYNVSPTLNVTIKNEVTNAIITQNISYSLTSIGANITQIIGTTVTGTFVGNITPGNYLLRLVSQNFSTRDYNIALTDSANLFTAYLAPNSTTSTTFFFRDIGGSELQSVQCNVRTFIGGVLTSVSIISSDVTGTSIFGYQPGSYYDFNCSLSGYQDKYFVLNPILSSSYTIPMLVSGSSQVTPTATVNWHPLTYQANVPINFSITFNSPYGNLISYGFNATYPGGSIAGSGNNLYGETFNNLVTTTGNWGDHFVIYYNYTLDNGQYFNYTVSYPLIPQLSNRTIMSSQNNIFGFETGDKVFLVSFIALILMGLAYLAMGLFGSLAIGGIVIGIFMNNGFLTQTESTLFLISLILIVLLMVFRGRQ